MALDYWWEVPSSINNDFFLSELDLACKHIMHALLFIKSLWKKHTMMGASFNQENYRRMCCTAIECVPRQETPIRLKNASQSLQGTIYWAPVATSTRSQLVMHHLLHSWEQANDWWGLGTCKREWLGIVIWEIRTKITNDNARYHQVKIHPREHIRLLVGHHISFCWSARCYRMPNVIEAHKK